MREKTLLTTLRKEEAERVKVFFHIRDWLKKEEAFL